VSEGRDPADGTAGSAAEIARFEALGARRIDVGQSDDVTWVVLADPQATSSASSGH
jgi:hypothetical protein